jgi:hypothetical protein
LSLTLIVWCLAFGLTSGWLARRRGRSTPLWVLFGALLGPVALLLLWMAPPGLCPTCLAPVRGWSAICDWCGGQVNLHPTGIGMSMATRAPVRSVHSESSWRSRLHSMTSGQIRRRGIGRPRMPRPRNEADLHAREPKVRRDTRTERPVSPNARFLASGVYITGSLGLSAGSRYGIAVEGRNLVILGPFDISPRAVVVERDLADIKATSFDDRLVISQLRSGRQRMGLVFASMTGGVPESVALAIDVAAVGAGTVGK